MTLSTTSSNDDKTFSSKAQLNLRMFNEALPEVLPETGSPQSADASRKRALDQSGTSTYKLADPNNMADMPARMEAIFAKRRKTASRVDEDVRIVVNQGSKASNLSSPPPPNKFKPQGKQPESIGKVKGHQRLKENSQDHGDLDQNQGYRKKIKNLRRKLRRIEKDKQQEVGKLKRELRWDKSEK